MEFLTSFAPLAARFDAFILDLWGVIHDGKQPYPGVKDTLQELHAAGKKIVFLSNAPRRAAAAAAVMESMGIGSHLYDALITSGEAAYQHLAREKGRHYVYIGLEKDRKILEGLPYEEAEPEKADFLLLSHSYVDNQPIAELQPLLDRCIARKLPALCINPDKEVVRMGGARVYCAGVLAEHYRNMRGEVKYFGKPHQAVYDLSLQVFAGIDKPRILAVGDSMATDIKGAQNNGLACSLVTGGILHETVGGATEAELKAFFAREKITPDFVVPAFK